MAVTAAITASSIESGEPVEVEIGVCQLEDVLGLRTRESEHGEMAWSGLSHALARRKLPRLVVADAEPLDEVATDGGGGTE